MGETFSSDSHCDDDEVIIKDDIVDGPELDVNWLDFNVRNYTRLENLKPKLRAGDLVSASRGAIEHVVVYIGDGYCVHFYAQGQGGKKDRKQSIIDFLLMSVPFMPAKTANHPGVVALETIDSVVGNDKCRIDNRIKQALASGLRKRRTAGKIVEEARKAWERGQHSPPDYNIVNYNCEVFALEIRYGVKITSEQISQRFHEEL